MKRTWNAWQGLLVFCVAMCFMVAMLMACQSGRDTGQNGKETCLNIGYDYAVSFVLEVADTASYCLYTAGARVMPASLASVAPLYDHRQTDEPGAMVKYRQYASNLLSYIDVTNRHNVAPQIGEFSDRTV